MRPRILPRFAKEQSVCLSVKYSSEILMAKDMNGYLFDLSVFRVKYQMYRR